MEQFPKSSAMPEQVCTVDDVLDLIAQGKNDLARDWCVRKIAYLQQIINEAEQARQSKPTGTDLDWENHQRYFEVEIEIWQTLLADIDTILEV